MSAPESVLKDPSTAKALPAIAQVLIQHGTLKETTAVELVQRSRQSKSSFIAETLNAGHISAADMAHTLAQKFSLPLLDIAVVDKK